MPPPGGLFVRQEAPESDEVQMMPPSAAATTLVPSAEHATEFQSKFVGAAVSNQT